MSRGIKDLRELICVSRLTIRDSDDELEFSDDEGRASRLSMMGQKLEVLSPESETDSRQSSGTSRGPPPGTPDSGISTNGHTLKEQSAEPTPTPPKEGRPKSRKKNKNRNRASKSMTSELLTLHELPKPAPLPPVQSSPSITASSRPSSSSSESTASIPSGMRRIGGARGPRVGSSRISHRQTAKTDYDQMLSYLDPSIVGEWLETAHKSVQKLAVWVHHKDNYVQFAHFWLDNFTDVQKQEIFQLEHSILLDNLEYGFSQGRDVAKVTHRDLLEFLSAIFREYPAKLMSAKGPHMFLDYLDILTSERTKSYKILLSDVKCSTRNRHYAQLVLACRCFVLVSVWSAVVNFYCRLVGEKDTNNNSGTELPDMSRLRPSNQRMYVAMRHGYLDVVYYMLQTGKIRTTFKDPNDRTLLFTAVIHNRPKILHFLLNNVRPTPDVNQAAETGNTPLHAAAHCGYHEILQLLLQAPGVEKNPCNPDMDGASPLHLATMHGHSKCVSVLLAGGVDTSMEMGGLTALQIAQDFGQDEICQLLQNQKQS